LQVALLLNSWVFSVATALIWSNSSDADTASRQQEEEGGAALALALAAAVSAVVVAVVEAVAGATVMEVRALIPKTTKRTWLASLPTTWRCFQSSGASSAGVGGRC
jgi:hypothetical protein